MINVAGIVMNVALENIVSYLVTNLFSNVSGRDSVSLLEYLEAINAEFARTTESIVRHAILESELREIASYHTLVCTKLEKYARNKSESHYLVEAESMSDLMHAKWTTLCPSFLRDDRIHYRVKLTALRLLRCIATQDILVQATLNHEEITRARALEYNHQLKELLIFFNALPDQEKKPESTIIPLSLTLWVKPDSHPDYLATIGYFKAADSEGPRRPDLRDSSLYKFEEFLQACARVERKPAITLPRPLEIPRDFLRDERAYIPGMLCIGFS